MSYHRIDAVGVGGTLLTALGLAAAYPRLPANVATHWTLANEVDGTMGKPAFAAFSVLLVAGTYGFMWILPRFDSSVELTDPLYETVTAATLAFLLTVNGYVIAVNLGYPIPVDLATPVAMAGLYAVLGTAMVRFDGSAMGTWPRTPEARAYVNDVLGRSFQLAAILTLAALAFPAYTMPLVVTISVVVPLAALVYAAVRQRA